MRTFTASGLFVLLVCSAVIAAAERPWFCHELDCPKFTVTRKNDFYETRIYTKGEVACGRRLRLIVAFADSPDTQRSSRSGTDSMAAMQANGRPPRSRATYMLLH